LITLWFGLVLEEGCIFNCWNPSSSSSNSLWNYNCLCLICYACSSAPFCKKQDNLPSFARIVQLEFSPGSWGPPWNLLVSYTVFLSGSYGSLKACFHNSRYNLQETTASQVYYSIMVFSIPVFESVWIRIPEDRNPEDLDNPEEVIQKISNPEDI
jgi:hypothetical protein